jgi:ribosomal protein L3
MSMAHCPAPQCHLTFGSVKSFDQHIVGDPHQLTHRHPATIGLRWNPGRACWSEDYNGPRP